MIDRALFSEDHGAWRATLRRIVGAEIAPHHAEWEQDGVVPRELWLKAGEKVLLCCSVPEQYGGLGLDYLLDVVVSKSFGGSVQAVQAFSSIRTSSPLTRSRLPVRSRRAIGCQEWRAARRLVGWA